MAHATEYTDTDLVVFKMTRDEAELLEEALGGMWSGNHDHLWEALVGRKKVSSEDLTPRLG